VAARGVIAGHHPADYRAPRYGPKSGCPGWRPGFASTRTELRSSRRLFSRGPAASPAILEAYDVADATSLVFNTSTRRPARSRHHAHSLYLKARETVEANQASSPVETIAAATAVTVPAVRKRFERSGASLIAHRRPRVLPPEGR